MRIFISLLILITVIHTGSAQKLYSKAYGYPKNPAIIYIHGGPRGNATLFESTTARLLAERGYYVIAYDRRGEGRSADTNATFTFQEAFNDLNTLLAQYHVKKVNLLGHSFGGIVATLYTQQYPGNVEKLFLAGALFTQQQTYDHILASVGKLAKAQSDTATINKIALIKTMNQQSADYRQQCYEVAGDYGYFRMPYPTERQKELYKEYEQNEFGKNNIRNNQAPVLFYQNEKLVNIDTRKALKNIKSKGIKVYALYGKQDRIFSSAQINDMKKITGRKHFIHLENCSHYPFVDQQEAFLQAVAKNL